MLAWGRRCLPRSPRSPSPEGGVACLGALFSPPAIAAVRSAPAGHDATTVVTTTTVAAITPVTTYVASHHTTALPH